MLTIERVEHFGFINFAVMYNNIELVRFDRYTHAVDFILFMDETQQA